ncbi:hypothetical protein LOK49_Contig213G00008 [Camellia lanceoleosa]|nr:hypothetical protein LOK49_Contig213G00008 [Camellia lanceoleosa]
MVEKTNTIMAVPNAGGAQDVSVSEKNGFIRSVSGSVGLGPGLNLEAVLSKAHSGGNSVSLAQKFSGPSSPGNLIVPKKIILDAGGALDHDQVQIGEGSGVILGKFAESSTSAAQTRRPARERRVKDAPCQLWSVLSLLICFWYISWTAIGLVLVNRDDGAAAN